MRKILSSKINETAVSVGLLMLRIMTGMLMLPHGYSKLVGFSEKQEKFIDFLGLGGTVSLALVIFAEFFCSLFLITGLFTRLFVAPLVVAMLVATFQAHGGDIFGKAELPFFYLVVYVVLLVCGPGKYSIDKLIFKERK